MGDLRIEITLEPLLNAQAFDFAIKSAEDVRNIGTIGTGWDKGGIVVDIIEAGVLEESGSTAIAAELESRGYKSRVCTGGNAHKSSDVNDGQLHVCMRRLMCKGFGPIECLPMRT